MSRVKKIEFRTLFESAPGLYLVLNRDLRIVAVTDAYLSATMTVRENILGRGIFDVFPDNPADPSATGVHNLHASLIHVLEKGAPEVMPIQRFDIQRPESEGGGFEERYWSPVNSPVFGPHRRVRYIIHRVADVTDFVRAQQGGAGMETEVYARSRELEEENSQLRSSNQALERLHRQISQLMAQAGSELLLGPTKSWAQVPMATAEEIVNRVSNLISTRDQLEEQLRQSLKMDAIGRLAGGVAHDFNNLLTAILGYNDMLCEEVRDRPEALGYAGEVRLAAETAAALTFQLLAFSRRQVTQPQVLDLNTSVARIDKMLRRIIGEDIELEVRAADGLRMVRADPSQVDQIIMNLVVNARDAMPEGGKVVVETANVELTEQYSGRHIGVQPGWYAMLAVSDTGRGMDAATRSRIFEPFFTTKDAGIGTGLGLSIVYGIVKQSGGDILVHSEPGVGTSFKIYLPAVAKEARTTPARNSHARPTPAGETILLVEDEDQVRNLTRGMLKREGYRVLEASGGEEALAPIRDPRERIDLLLTDIAMPRMRGTELAREARQLRPGLKVLYMSGYTDASVANRDAIEPGALFLQKPFTALDLHETVQAALGDSDAAGAAGG
jgi:signal transduction histidine kinase/ActR/RegA family two-component response regulator